jgi:hypothetical protein
MAVLYFTSFVPLFSTLLFQKKLYTAQCSTLSLESKFCGNRSRFRSEFRSRIHTQTHTDTHTHTQPLSRTCQISWAVDISRCEEGFVLFVYYESTKREQKIKPIYECRCDERLQTKTKRFAQDLRVSHTLVWSWNWNT